MPIVNFLKNNINSLIPSLNPMWFGAAGDGVSDDYTALDTAVLRLVAEGIHAAVAFNHADYGAGLHDAVPDGTVANFTTKTTAARAVIMPVAGADLTAGKVRIWADYVIGD